MDKPGVMGPLCEKTGVYVSRCEHCGAEPMNASVNAEASNIPPTAPTLEGTCNRWRAELLGTEHYVRGLVTEGKVRGEAAEQAMLAVRHLEDARMRLGKVIQHTAGGGVSCFDSGRKTADDGR